VSDLDTVVAGRTRDDTKVDTLLRRLWHLNSQGPLQLHLSFLEELKLLPVVKACRFLRDFMTWCGDDETCEPPSFDNWEDFSCHPPLLAQIGASYAGFCFLLSFDRPLSKSSSFFSPISLLTIRSVV